jgi:cytidine deaminase
MANGDGATTMDESVRELFDAACAVRERAHCRYSNYPVGAAIRTTTGDVFVGCNVENASYPEGTCAESGAIAAMVASSHIGVTPLITMIVTVTAGETPGTPCGGCRQRIREFSTPATTIHAMTVSGRALTMSIDELLPESFGPERLL